MILVEIYPTQKPTTLKYSPSVAPCNNAAAGTCVRSLPLACSSWAAAAAFPDRPPPAAKPAEPRPWLPPDRPPYKAGKKLMLVVCG